MRSVCAAVGPGCVVVGVAHGWWSVAVFGGAAFVADAHGDALGACVAAAAAAEVEDLGSAAEDGGDDAGGAGQAAGNGGGDLAAGVEVADAGGVEVGEELVEPSW